MRKGPASNIHNETTSVRLGWLEREYIAGSGYWYRVATGGRGTQCRGTARGPPAARVARPDDRDVVKWWVGHEK